MGDDASSRVGVRGVEFGVGVGVGVVFAFAFVVVVVVVVFGDGGRPAVDARGGDVRGRRAGEGVVVECVVVVERRGVVFLERVERRRR